MNDASICPSEVIELKSLEYLSSSIVSILLCDASITGGAFPVLKGFKN